MGVVAVVARAGRAEHGDEHEQREDPAWGAHGCGMIREPPRRPPRTCGNSKLRRHARRDPDADRLSAAGRAQAEDVGRASAATYDVVFVSPAQRAAETAAWFLRGAGQQLPDHEVVPGLGGQDATGGSPEGMAAGRAGVARPHPRRRDAAWRSATRRSSSAPRSA